MVGTEVSMIDSGGSCQAIEVASASFPAILSLSKLSSELDSTFLTSPLLSSDWDSVWAGEVWGFFFMGPLGGMSSRVTTFFPHVYLWSPTLTFPFIVSLTKSLLLWMTK